MIEIAPIHKLDSSIHIPPSKSYTNRALIAAALARGESIIRNPLKSDDTMYMAQALRQFKVMVVEEADAFRVYGTGGRILAPAKEIYVGNAGTAMRFLTTFAALAPGKTLLTGDHRMQERPIGDLLQALTDLGITAKSVNGNECPPLEINGGELSTDTVTLPGSRSSQYLTSLLLSLPAFAKGVTIEIEGKLTSTPYIDITLEVLADFGIHIDRKGNESFGIKPNQHYQADEYTVQGDASSASYFFAAAAVAGGRVTIHGIHPSTLQGDIRFLDLLEKMGCMVKRGSDEVTVTGGKLHGVRVDMNSMPDVAQTAAVVALFAEGETTITNIANLRIKETDRITALANELRKLGADVEEGSDWITIKPGDYHGASIETYNDHRMAMSFAVAGLRIPGVKIENPDCVKKSFPSFFEIFQKFSSEDGGNI